MALYGPLSAWRNRACQERATGRASPASECTNVVPALRRDPDVGRLRLPYFAVGVVYNFTEARVQDAGPRLDHIPPGDNACSGRFGTNKNQKPSPTSDV